MKKSYVLIVLLFVHIGNILADELPKDTIKVVDIEEVIIIASPKENRKLREQPISSTMLSQQDMQVNQVTSIKDLTALVPNMFIPDYGSKMTSAVYIRGIGSRINTPSVGLYVDNMPFIDKSAFDFNYSDIERIDILRGPQGTLYGRNTMGGLIKVHTKSPFSYQGTDLKIGAGTYSNYNASLTHYHRISDKFAFSAGGFYGYEDGFFKNVARNNEKTGRVSEGGGRVRGIYLPSDNLKIDLSLSYEYSDQDGYPYYYTGAVNPEEEKRSEYIGKIFIDDKTGYYRSLFNSGANIEYQAKNVILSFVTGYQHMKDRMSLDQDFTEEPLFSMTQSQKINTLSEEIVLKSKPGRNWQWTTGVFGFYQWLDTDAPVTFKNQGIKDMIENNANKAFENLGPRAPSMHLTINNPSLLINDKFDTPTFNTAVYHQSTFNNLFTKGLSFTAGLRLDYEKTTIKYDAYSDPIDFDFDLSMTSPRPIHLTDNMQAPAELNGKLSNDYLQLLPKFALEYEWKKGNNVYISASRGYRSGGYNLQLFSDLVKSELQNSMKTSLQKSEVFKSQASMIEAYMPSTEIKVDSATSYKPEYSWNYEIGSHLTLWEGRLWADLAAYYMDTRDQQISKFVESGLGRIIVNAGKSRSYGVEIALRSSITESLSFNTSYGYTHSTFTDYVTNNNVNGEMVDINYDGNYVPFVPKHTFNVGGQYIFFISPNHWLDQVQVNLNYNGAGRIYWTEQNNASQSFYGTLNGHIALNKGNGQIAFWARNILNETYNTFYFENMGSGFAQKGRPVQIGIDFRCRF